MESWKIIVRHRLYNKVGKSWKCYDDTTEEITRQQYERLHAEKWSGDYRQYNYTPFGYMTVYLSNTDNEIGKKSIREFVFRKVGK